MRDQLLRVLVLLDAAEVFEQALDQRPAVLDEAGAQGLQPGVQRPGNAWEQNRADSEYTRGGVNPRNRTNHGFVVSVAGGKGKAEATSEGRLKAGMDGSD